MTSRQSLIEKITTFLENSLIEPSVNFKYTNGLIASDVIDGRVCSNPKMVVFINDQVIALKALYVQLSKPDQEFFIEFLLKILKEDGRTDKIAFNTLCHLGLFSKTFPLIQKEILNVPLAQKYYRILTLYEELLKYEWNNYSLDELRRIKLWIDERLNPKKTLSARMNLSPYQLMAFRFDQIYRQINIILTKAFKEEIFSGYNPEINEDQNKLTKEFDRYNFPPDLAQTLEKIDDNLIKASDRFDYKSCMDLLRSFTERLYEGICIALDNTEGRKVNVKDSDEVAKFFMSKKLLSVNQTSLLVSLRHFLSNEASHKLKSKQEDARLTRNITIEYSLYLMKRLEARQTE